MSDKIDKANAKEKKEKKKEEEKPKDSKKKKEQDKDKEKELLSDKNMDINDNLNGITYLIRFKNFQPV